MGTVPQRLDKYELIARLGSGGAAEVWKASDTQLQRFVALKVLHPNLREDPTFLVRFQREAQFVASLHHPNIVQIHDFQIFQPVDATVNAGNTSDSTPIAYMVMDYVEGETLADYIQAMSGQGKMPTPGEIVNLFTALSLAVDYAHRNGMIHRDIKPANILLDQRNRVRNPMGEPMLSDFGLAKLLSSSVTMQTGLQLSTPTYISPEQAKGYPGSERSDLYSLGVILYEMTTGVLPFQGDTPVAVMTQHINAVPPAPASINPKISPLLEQVILRSMAKDPAQRFASASAMTVALAQALQVPVPRILEPAIQNAAASSPDLLAEPTAHGGIYTTPVVPAAQVEVPAPVLPRQAAVSVPTSKVSSAVATPPRQRKRRGLLIPFIALLVVLLIIAGLGVFLLPPLLSPPSSVVGQAFYASSGQSNPEIPASGIADQMQIDLQNVPAPASGKSYYAWLLNDNVKIGGTDLVGAPPFSPPLLLTNNLPVQNGLIHYFYAGDAQHNNLLSTTSRLLITEEAANKTPASPIADRSAWRYYAFIPQKAIVGDPTGLNALNHIRHLFYNESKVEVLGLPGGLDFWLSRNTEKVFESAVSARDFWHGPQTTDDQIRQMNDHFINILDLIDGSINFHVDIPADTPLRADPTGSRIGLLTVDPNRQSNDLAHNPPGYIDHTQLHVEQISRASDITADMRLRTAHILDALKNAGKSLQTVHDKALALFRLGSDPTQLRQPTAEQFLDDLLSYATYAYIGQRDPDTNQVNPGVIQAHYEIEKLAVLNITRDLPASL